MVPFAGSATANCTGILMGVTSPSGGVHTYMASAVRSPLGFRWALGGWRPVLALAGLARVAAGRDLCARACALQSRRPARHRRRYSALVCTCARLAPQPQSHIVGDIPIATGLSVPGGAAMCRRACCMPAVLPAGRPVRATNNVNHSWNPLNR